MNVKTKLDGELYVLFSSICLGFSLTFLFFAMKTFSLNNDRIIIFKRLYILSTSIWASINHLPDVSSSGKHENLRLKQIKTGSLFHRVLDSEPNYELHTPHQKKSSPLTPEPSRFHLPECTHCINFFSNFIYNSISLSLRG